MRYLQGVCQLFKTEIFGYVEVNHHVTYINENVNKYSFNANTVIRRLTSLIGSKIRDVTRVMA
jgi:hypothetical protein